MGYVVCGGCAAQIPTNYWNVGGQLPCPGCARGVEVHVFPAAMRRAEGAAPEPVITGEEASCYNHPMHRAAAACDSCGRFLCALCDIPTGAAHVCPACFETGGSRILERTNFDSLALAIATLPMLLCWLPILTTPAALYFAISHWNDPSPVVPRGKWRLWLTLIVAAMQAALYAWLIYFVVTSSRQGAR